MLQEDGSLLVSQRTKHHVDIDDEAPVSHALFLGARMSLMFPCVSTTLRRPRVIHVLSFVPAVSPHMTYCGICPNLKSLIHSNAEARPIDRVSIPSRSSTSPDFGASTSDSSAAFCRYLR